jgi:hypothetical protein
MDRGRNQLRTLRLCDLYAREIAWLARMVLSFARRFSTPVMAELLL